LSTRDGSRGTVTHPITLPPGDRTGERPHVQWDHVTAPRLSGVPARATTSTVLLVVAIVVLALNLRGPIVAVSAVLEPIRADLGISASTAGLLTSLPVLCFGLATPLASALLGRAGLGRGVSISLIVLLLGIVVRSLDGLPAALAGTVLIGLAVTVANVAVPVVIGQDLPRWSGAVLGVYTAALNVGSMITLTFTVPIADAAGWRIALLAWGALVLGGLAVWWYATRRQVRADPAGPADDPTGHDPAASDDRVWWRRPVVWGLTTGFAGQAFAYYGVTAWLPLLLRDELDMTLGAAGASASIFQIAALVGAFGVPVLLRVCPGPRMVVLIVAAAWTTLPLGLLLAPQLWALWCSVAGAAQGGGLVVIFALVVRRARDQTDSRRMSALVQGGGYLVAATGPTVVGAVHEATLSWTAPLLVVLAAILLMGAAATASAGRTGMRRTT
jgi:MFS transporter, CP family, cyanate transporter